MPLSNIVRPFAISGPASSRHLRVLERARLIERKASAQWRICRLSPPGLRAADEWMLPCGMKLRSARVDVRICGAWRVDMLARDGSSQAVHGHYTQVGRPSRLVYTWQWESEQGRPSFTGTIPQ